MDASVTTPLLVDSSLSAQPRLRPVAHEDDRHQQRACPVDSADERANENSKRRVGFYDSVAMVLGTQIGSGIFISPSLVARNSGSVPLALLIWSLAGLLAWACALCYAELGTRMPLNGGPQEYLAHCFNDLAGFLASWGTIFALKSCSAAMLAIFISNSVCDALGIRDAPFDYPRKLGALQITILITTINCAGNTQSKIVTKLLLACKIFGLGFVLVLGLVGLFVPPSSATVSTDAKSLLHANLSNYTDAMLQALWAYSGWETLAFIGGELENPSRIIRPVTNISMAIISVLFSLTNVAYFSALTFEEIVNSTTIAMTYSEHFLGRAGGILYAAVIGLSALGTLNVKAFTAARITQAAAERQYLPLLMKTVEKIPSNGMDPPVPVARSLGIWAHLHHPTHFADGTIPLSAIIFNSLLTVIYIMIGDLDSLVTFIGLVEYSIVLLTLCGLVTLRLRERSSPGDRGPNTFRVSWFLIVAALLATSFILCVSVSRHPFAGLGYLGFLAISTMIHSYIVRT